MPKALAGIVVKDLGFGHAQVRYFLAGERVLPSGVLEMAFWRERLFALMHRNSMSAATYFHLPPRQVMEIGMQVEI